MNKRDFKRLMKDSWRLEKYREIYKLLTEQARLTIEKLEELKNCKYGIELNKDGFSTLVFKNEVNEKIDEMIKELKGDN